MSTLVVDGRILKRAGKLAAVDTPKMSPRRRGARGRPERTKWR